MKKIILSALLAVFSPIVLADSIVTETKTWKSVPITIPEGTQTYTIQNSEAVPTQGDYYYTYSGYRCLANKKDLPGEVTYHAQSGEGNDVIYCYPEQ